MADYTFTGSAVLLYGTDKVPVDGIAGEALTAGDLCYQKAADNKWYKAQCDGTAEEANPTGVALVSSLAAGAPCVMAPVGSEITVQGACFASAGLPLALSAAAGKNMDAGDLASTNKINFTGYTTAVNRWKFQPNNTGITKA